MSKLVLIFGTEQCIAAMKHTKFVVVLSELSITIRKYQFQGKVADKCQIFNGF